MMVLAARNAAGVTAPRRATAKPSRADTDMTHLYPRSRHVGVCYLTCNLLVVSCAWCKSPLTKLICVDVDQTFSDRL